jgi:hypothetical protein
MGGWPEIPNKRRRAGRENLPTIAAIAAVTPITTSSAATATATAISAVTAASSTTAAIAAATASASGAFGLRTGFVDDEISATKVLTVQAGNGAVCVFIAGDFDEGKATRLPCKAVPNQTNCRWTDPQLTKPFL